MTVTLEELKNLQAERAKQFGIGVKENYGFIEKPKIYESIADEDFADPVHYQYPVNDKPNTLASWRIFGNWDSKYTDSEKQIIFAKLYSAFEKFKIDLTKTYFSEPEENTIDSDNWIDVFKVGNHTDSSGSSKQWSESDLNTIVDKYNNQSDESKHRAPAIVGEHQSDTSLVAYGWVKALKVEDGHLYAQFEKLNTDFQDMVNDGSFNTVSIGLYPNLLLQHVAFLGAKPPAIKGLKPPQFSESSIIVTMSYAENNNNSKINLKGNPMDEFIRAVTAFLREKYGVETANDALAKMNELKGTVSLTAPAGKDKNTSDTNGGKKPTFSESPEYMAYQAERNADKERLQKIEAELQTERDKAYFSEMAKAGILLPKQHIAAKRVLEAIRNPQPTYQFSETESPVTGEETFKEFVKTFPPAVVFGEFAPRDNSSNPNSAEERRKSMEEFINNRKAKRSRR